MRAYAAREAAVQRAATIAREPAEPAQPAPLPSARAPLRLILEGALIRVGHGYDLHRLEPLAPAGAGRPLRLGGVEIPAERGPVSHSDGDALLHAVTDALLGALGAPDIGELFPDNDPRNAGRDSAEFLAEATRRVRAAGLRIANLDATVILERPKLAPHKARIRAQLAVLLGVDAEAVNIKGKTHERVDAVGEGRAVEVHAVVALVGGSA